MPKQPKIYIVGIEGAGTSALATLYKRRGYDVSGSDNGDGFYAPALQREGIPVFRSFSRDNVPDDVDWIVYSTAFENNEEVSRGRELGRETISYPEAIAREFNQSYGIAIAGTHGKTTTTALAGSVLAQCGLDPTALVGGRVVGWDGNFLGGNGKHFVLEADEYQDKLRHYQPVGVILTSLDWDHPDFFPDLDAYRNVFTAFVRRIPKHGVLVYCGDSALVSEVAESASCTKICYGFTSSAEYRIEAHTPICGAPGEGAKQSFAISVGDESLGTYELRLAGRHNAQNAAAVIALADFLKLDRSAVHDALRNFSGVERRFEYKGEHNGALVYDDYAHHPEEIAATLSAFRGLYPDRKIYVLFHPHTYSRTAALLQEFSQSFDEADRVFLLDIYGSARETAGGVSSDDLAGAINRYVKGKAENIHSIDEAIAKFSGMIGEGDVLVTMGAGDVWKVAQRLKQ